MASLHPHMDQAPIECYGESVKLDKNSNSSNLLVFRTMADALNQNTKRIIGFVHLILLLIALISSILLLNLFIEVNQVGPDQIKSFCQINENFDCVTVAASKYAVFLKIPIALYSVEFFAVVLVAFLLAFSGAWKLKHWDSLLFICYIMALPVALIMATVAIFFIKSICILCTAIYGSTIVGVLIYLVAYRKSLPALFISGPKELLKSGGFGRNFLIAIILVGLSQFLWVPAYFARPYQLSKDFAGVPTQGMTIGSKDASLVIHEFTDYECPHCRLGHEIMLKLVEKHPQKVRVIHHDYPLDNACNPKIKRPFHQKACQAAFYARCAAKQGQYWPFAVTLFGNQRNLDLDDLKSYANKLKLDWAALEKCAHSNDIKKELQADIESALNKGVFATPTFIANGQKVMGPRRLEFWEKLIDKKPPTSTTPKPQ